MKNHYIWNVIVIGGGPSGMMCAGTAASGGKHVLLLEKNSSLGNKLLLTGGGRCNITNAIFDIEQLLSYFPASKKYLYSPFSTFSVSDTFEFFEKCGLPLVIEARNRVFPVTQSSQTVLDVMRKYMLSNRVTVQKQTRIVSMHHDDSRIISICDDKGIHYRAHAFVIATGGLAAPETGSTGDGHLILKNIGHTVHTANPNLVPLTTSARWIKRLSGISWSFMKIRFVQNGKTRVRKIGKILFTHFGISGPLVINAAYEVKQLLANGPVEAIIDLFPDTDENELDKKMISLLQNNSDKKMKNILPDMIFKNIALEILSLPHIDLAEAYAKNITRSERKNLVKTIKNLSFPITGTCGMDKAIVADGGIDLSEVNFKNMTSRLYPNLYLLGDVLNINRPSGGFSLQLCWTTGFVAGTDLAQRTMKAPQKP